MSGTETCMEKGGLLSSGGRKGKVGGKMDRNAVLTCSKTLKQIYQQQKQQSMLNMSRLGR